MRGKYFVAKYVPDLARLEPKNIGVFLQLSGGVLTRFVGERPHGEGLDLRTVRGIVSHTGTYKQWIDYWKYVLKQGDTETALTEILLRSRGNYVVTDGASISVPENASATELLNQLFYSLVTEFPEPRVEELTLVARCNEIFSTYGLNQDPHFQESPSVLCRLSTDLVENIRPSYGWVNGREVYFQRVSFNPVKIELTQKDVHNAAWIFDRLRASYPSAEKNALVKLVGDDDPATFNEAARGYWKVLGAFSDAVVNVDDDAEVDSIFANLAR